MNYSSCQGGAENIFEFLTEAIKSNTINYSAGKVSAQKLKEGGAAWQRLI